MQDMKDLAAIAPGTALGPYRIRLDSERAEAYARAVGGPESPAYGETLPPAAIIAVGLSTLIEDLDLFSKKLLDAGGVVHTSQEAEFLAPLQRDDDVIATAKMTGNTLRRGSRFISIFTEFRNSSNDIVATASSTIVVPG